MPMMNQGEVVIAQESVKMIHRKQVHSGGTLFLTNQRILYESTKREGGFSSFLSAATVQTILNADIRGITNVIESRPTLSIPFFSRNIVRLEFQNQSYEFAVQYPGSWKNLIITELHKVRNYESQQRVEQERQRKEHEEREFQRKLKLQEAGSNKTVVSVGNVMGAQANRSTSTNTTTNIQDSVIQRSQIGGGSSEPQGMPPCPSCRAPIQSTWKLCPLCGVHLSSACPSCGTAAQPGWKLCPNCGNPLC